MGWLRALFSGHSPEAMREVMKLAVRQNLRRASNRSPIAARLDAGTHALNNRYRARGYNKPLELLVVEVFPFAFLPANDFEAGLAEYVVAGEHRGNSDAEWLVRTVRNGVKAAMEYPDPAYAELKLRLFRTIDADTELVPWFLCLDQESLGHIWVGAKSAMEQLGMDTTGMDDESV